MNIKSKLLKLLLIIMFCNIFISCTTSYSNDKLPTPKIEAGVVKVYGKITNFQPEKTQTNLSFQLRIPNPITVETTMLECQVDENGEFRFDVPIEFTPVIGVLSSTALDDIYILSLENTKDAIIELTYDGKEKWNLIYEYNLLQDNASVFGDLMIEMSFLGPEKKYKYINRDSVYHFIEQPTALIPYLMKYDLGQRLETVERDSTVSERGSNYISNEFKRMYMGEFFAYSDVISELYNETRTESDTVAFTPPSPDISYYTFLKECDLNNPSYIYTTRYARTYQNILGDTILNIVRIGDSPINQWIGDAKEILVNLVGFEDGLFYDVLIGNAYSKQFIDDLKPLSEVQKKNIHNYFKGGEIEKILLRKNEEIERLAKGKQKAIINKTPAVAKEKMMDAIVSNYKGKVVVVDFWATWCGPCLSVMQEFRETKIDFIDKDVIFVYIANSSSPLKLWKEKIEGIGSEHYYLTGNDEWDYIMDEFNFEGIPSYLIYDKDGILKQKQTSFMGNKQMKEWIEELL